MARFKKKTYRKKKTSWSKKSRSKKKMTISKRVRDLEKATKSWSIESTSVASLGGSSTTVTNGLWLTNSTPISYAGSNSANAAITKSISIHLQITRASAVTTGYTFQTFDQGVRVMVVCQKNPAGQFSSTAPLLNEILFDGTGGAPTQATFYGSKYNPDYIGGYRVVYDKCHRVECLGEGVSGAVNATNTTMMKQIRINVKPPKYGLEDIRIDPLDDGDAHSQEEATKNHWFLFVTPYDKTTGNKNSNLGMDVEWSVFYEH